MIEVTTRQSFVGSTATMAADMERFVRDQVCDGFILVPYITPGGLDDFADQRRSPPPGARCVPRRLRGHHPAPASGAGPARRTTPTRRGQRLRRPGSDGVTGDACAALGAGSGAGGIRGDRRPRRPQLHRPGPPGRGAGLPPVLVRRTPPEPGSGRHRSGGHDRAGRRRHPHHPGRVGGSSARAPHASLGGRGVRSARLCLSGSAGSRPGPHPGHAATPARRSNRSVIRSPVRHRHLATPKTAGPSTASSSPPRPRSSGSGARPAWPWPAACSSNRTR